MQNLKCVIADDEDLAIALLEDYIRQNPELTLSGTCENGPQLNEFLENQAIDLIFLDIQMPYLTGLEFLEQTQNRPAVIITTSYSDYALDAFRLNVVDYLLKPFPPERFRQAIEKVLEFMAFREAFQHSQQSEKPDYIFVKTDYKMLKINLKDILYIEGLKQYVKIFTTEKMIITLDTLKNMEAVLPEANFMRIHKSFIVAMDKIEAAKPTSIVIRQKKLPVGRSYKSNFQRFLLNFC